MKHTEPDRYGEPVDALRVALQVEAMVACIIIAAICFFWGNLT